MPCLSASPCVPSKTRACFKHAGRAEGAHGRRFERAHGDVFNAHPHTVERQPVGKLPQQSFGEVQRVRLSKPTQSKPKPICDRSGKPEDTERVFFLWIKEKRPVPTRSMKSVCTKNLVPQIDRGNLRDCLKTFVLSMLTMEQGNLWSQAAQAHTQ